MSLSQSTSHQVICSEGKWRSRPALPAKRIVNCCFTATFKDQMVVATTVKQDDGSPAIVVFASELDCDFKWLRLIPPPVKGAHTLDGLCVEQLLGQLYVIVRPLRSSGDSPACHVWALSTDASGSLSPGSRWARECRVPNGHLCGTFQICGPSLIAAGGRSYRLPGQLQKAVDAFDLENGSWSVWPDLPFALYASAGVAMGEQRFIIVGGIKAGESPAAPASASLRVLFMDLVDGQPVGGWNFMASLEDPCLAPSATVYRGELLVFGTVLKSSRGAVRWWDRARTKWRSISGPPVSRLDVALTMFDGRLLCVGGQLAENGETSEQHCALVDDLRIFWRGTINSLSNSRNGFGGRRATLL